jgi:hypothetical protein
MSMSGSTPYRFASPQGQPGTFSPSATRRSTLLAGPNGRRLTIDDAAAILERRLSRAQLGRLCAELQAAVQEQEERVVAAQAHIAALARGGALDGIAAAGAASAAGRGGGAGRSLRAPPSQGGGAVQAGQGASLLRMVEWVVALPRRIFTRSPAQGAMGIVILLAVWWWLRVRRGMGAKGQR